MLHLASSKYKIKSHWVTLWLPIVKIMNHVWTFLFDIGEPKGEIGGILYTQFMNYQIYHDFYRKCFMRDLKHTSLGGMQKQHSQRKGKTKQN